MTASIFFGDIRAWWAEVLTYHPTPVVFGVFWLIMVMLSLKGVDRRDDLAHLTYAITLMAIGVSLYITGSAIAHSKPTAASILVVSSLTAAIAGLRWGFLRGTSVPLLAHQKINETKK